MHTYVILLDCGVTQILPMVVLSQMQYLEQELRIEGLSFPFDLEVRWLSWCVGTCSGAHALILAFTVYIVCVYVCMRTYICVHLAPYTHCTHSTETKLYTSCSSKGCIE